MFFAFYAEIQDGHQKLQENDFWKKLADDSADTVGIKNFAEIALFHAVSEINAFLHITQKFKIPVKMAGKQFLEKKCQMTMKIPRE